MGRAVSLKKQRRQIRRELNRQLHDANLHREVEEYMAAMRSEAFYLAFRLVEDGLRDLFGFGGKRIGKLIAYIKTRAIYDPYFERGLPLEEIEYKRRAV